MNLNEIKEKFESSSVNYFKLSFYGDDIFKPTQTSILGYQYIWDDEVSKIEQLITWGYTFCLDIGTDCYFYNDGVFELQNYYNDIDRMNYTKSKIINDETKAFYKSFILVRDHT